MKLNLDLPKYKWDSLAKHLDVLRQKDETVNTFCDAVESIEFGSDFPSKMYKFLSSHNDLNPLIFPTIQIINKYDGGPGILKSMYQFYDHASHARADYYKFIQNNFTITQTKEESK
tara:strand:- start:212 stop:559 length:348 start_codon:yes stop_codon:yes gene_type:complete